MKNNLRNALAAVCVFGLVGVSGTANAAGGYVGLGIGTAKSTFDTGSVQLISGPNFSVDDKGSSWRLFGGYQFNDNFSIEGAYVDLGEASVVATNSGVTNTFKSKVTGLEFTAIGSLPVGKDFSVLARGGLISWSSDTTVCLGGLGCGSASTTGSDFVLGVGARYDFSKQFGVRAEYTMYNIDKVAAGTGDFKVLSISGVISF